MNTLGSLYTYICGYLVQSWRGVAWLQLVPPALLAVSVLAIPDSPYWLVQHGRVAEARAALVRLRGPRYCVEQELAEIVDKRQRQGGERPGVLAALANRAFLLPFARIGALMLIGQVTQPLTYICRLLSKSFSKHN